MLPLAAVVFLAQRSAFGTASQDDLRLQNVVSLAIGKAVPLFSARGGDLHYTQVTSSELAEGRFGGGGAHLEFFDGVRRPLSGLMIRHTDLARAYEAVQEYAKEARSTQE